MLLELLTEKVIELDVEARDSIDAIKKAGDLMVKAGKVTEEYVESMIEMSEKIKGYIVIAPGIAMPHARPENGVCEIGVSLITLKDAVKFGNQSNDPVKLVISLAAKDSSAHVKLLQQLSMVLGNDTILEEILKCKSKGEVLKLFKNYIQNNIEGDGVRNV